AHFHPELASRLLESSNGKRLLICGCYREDLLPASPLYRPCSVVGFLEMTDAPDKVASTNQDGATVSVNGFERALRASRRFDRILVDDTVFNPFNTCSWRHRTGRLGAKSDRWCQRMLHGFARRSEATARLMVAGLMSVREKSSPLNSNGSPVNLASA